MPTPLRIWFADLRSIQRFVTNLNNATDADLKAFSRQTLGDLLPSDPWQQNLCQFVQNLTGEACPVNIFTDPKKDFRWFLDTLTRGPVLERLIIECYNVAQATINTGTFRLQKVNEVFTQPAALDALDLSLITQINEPDFYPSNCGVHTGGNLAVSIQDFCARIFV